jgi:hypothetical protein
MPHTMVNLVHKVFNESYYFQQLNDSPADGWSDYMSVGFDLDIPPSPFVNPALIRYFWNKSGTGNEASFDKTLTDAEFIALSPLLDVEYCAQQNNWQVADTRTNAISALRRGEWIDFHPLLTQRDFTNSRLKDISIWIETISDIERSLTDQVFERFSPSYYRATAASLIFSNELVDYLLNGINSGGAPHVFCDFWYSHQFSEKQGKPSRRSDVWQSMLIDFGHTERSCHLFSIPSNSIILSLSMTAWRLGSTLLQLFWRKAVRLFGLIRTSYHLRWLTPF